MRHEKDDRNRIDDRSRYVLGWSNEGKIRALEEQLEHHQAEGNTLLSRLVKTESALRNLDKHQAALLELLRPTEFALIDWSQSVAQIHQLQEEKRELEQSSDILRSLNARLAEVAKQLETSNKQLIELRDKIGGKKNDLSNAQSDLVDAKNILEQSPESERAICFASLDKAV